MSVNSYEDLAYHVGHEVVVDSWRQQDAMAPPACVSITCNTCCEILLDFDRPDVAEAINSVGGHDDR